MVGNVRELDPKRSPLLLVALATFLGPACGPTDHLLEPLVSEGGSYFSSLNTNTFGTSNGGSPSNGGASTTSSSPTNGGNSSPSSGTNSGAGGATATSQSQVASDPFDWGSGAYDVNGGANVGYQGHYTGMACLSSCHNHSFSVGGTVYQADGTTTAANVQIGILANGSLTTTYAGKQGNFFVSVNGNVDWANAQIALRNASGTKVMPSNASATGSCNDCHDSSNRIAAP